MLSGMAFHAADNHRATSEGAEGKGRLKERCGLEPRTNFFLRNQQKLVRIRFENIRYSSSTLVQSESKSVNEDSYKNYEYFFFYGT